MTIERRLRPTRVATLIDPADADTLSAAIALNTSLWGGAFNPVVPVLRRRPPWWNDSPWPDLSGAALTASYLEVWDPDLIINAAPSYKVPAQYQERLVELKEVRSQDPLRRRQVGVSVQAVYEHLHRHERRFMLRQPDDLVLPDAVDPALRRLVEVCYGRFDDPAVEQSYMSLLGAERLPLASGQLWNGILGGPRRFVGPLELGRHLVEVQRRGWNPLLVFICDGSSDFDLIDLWNLRAAGHQVLPLPLQAAQALGDVLVDSTAHLSEKQSRDIHLVVSRRLPREKQREIADGFLDRGVRAVHGWFPPHWHHASVVHDSVRLVSASQSSVETTPHDDGRVQVPLDAPPFGEAMSFGSRWANVLSLRQTYTWDEGANIFPARLGDLRRLLDAILVDDVRANWEGVVVRGRSTEEELLFRLPSSQEVVQAFLAREGLESHVSEPGQMTLEMIRRLGGLKAVWMLQNRALVHLFQKTARSETMNITRQQVDSAIAGSPHPHAGSSVRKQLTDRGVLKAGLLLRCAHCGFKNWYPPEALADEQGCAECLRTFPFPHDSPPGHWVYQAFGGFRARRQNAVGRYSVMLALHALDKYLGDLDWCTSLSVKGVGEIDFIGMYQRDRWEKTNRDPELIFGEVKTKTPLKERDFERFHEVQRRFPSAMLVFATLDESGFSSKEKSALRRLARPSGLYKDFYPGRAQLIVLTPAELFAPDIRDAVKAVQPDSPFRDQLFWDALLPALASYTQTEHLGLEDFDAWRQREGGRILKRLRVQRRKKTAS